MPEAASSLIQFILKSVAIIKAILLIDANLAKK